MDVAKILAQVKRLQIVASRQVNDLLAGEYASTFKGRGMEFDEVREYQPGDDVRSIDWNVTARADKPFVKRYQEERELTVLFAVDVSASNLFGSGERSKLELATELAALLMFSAAKNHDKVGLLLFDQEVRGYYPPRKGRGAVLRLLRELVAVEPRAPRRPRGDGRAQREALPTDLAGALSFLRRVQRRRAVVFVLSDFDCPDWELALRVTARRHELVAIPLSDPREQELPEVGFVELLDAETGEVLELDTRHRAVREAFAKRAAERSTAVRERLRRCDVDALELSTDRPYVVSLHAFFRRRERGRR
jgi:uncharacterized protein (DUF58 family)